MAAGYKWHPITDLGDDPRSLTDGELESLWRVWQSQKKDLAERSSRTGRPTKTLSSLRV
jgi:hypothetical protein